MPTGPVSARSVTGHRHNHRRTSRRCGNCFLSIRSGNKFSPTKLQNPVAQRNGDTTSVRCGNYLENHTPTQALVLEQHPQVGDEDPFFFTDEWTSQESPGFLRRHVTGISRQECKQAQMHCHRPGACMACPHKSLLSHERLKSYRKHLMSFLSPFPLSSVFFQKHVLTGLLSSRISGPQKF